MHRTLAFTIPLACSLLLTGCGSKNEGFQTKGEASLDDLSRALSVMTMQGKMPRTVYELTNFPALQGKTLPTPPAGKQLVIDYKSRKVVFADQQ